MAYLHKQWQIDALFLVDAPFYTENNLQMIVSLRWVSQVPATVTAAK
ncbi:hypothetical protein RintRC_2037 [Richelia intracellularis]|nr:hypothetical protein RintRC_2037 [Richelia intracellularis]